MENRFPHGTHEAPIPNRCLGFPILRSIIMVIHLEHLQGLYNNTFSVEKIKPLLWHPSSDKSTGNCSFPFCSCHGRLSSGKLILKSCVATLPVVIVKFKHHNHCQSMVIVSAFSISSSVFAPVITTLPLRKIRTTFGFSIL